MPPSGSGPCSTRPFSALAPTACWRVPGLVLATSPEFTASCEIYLALILVGAYFSAWLGEIQKEEGPARMQALALLSYLRDLAERPQVETATLKRVRQAKRHEIWRLAHPFDPDVAIRILCWFPDGHTAVLALVGGDKVRIGDVWYDSATPRAEAAVDQWQREQTEERS